MKGLKTVARRAIAMLDVTLLHDGCSEDDVLRLCGQVQTSVGCVAAVCIPLDFVGAAKRELQQIESNSVRVATVANFPAGEVDLVGARDEVQRAVDEGVDEIELLFPWRALMAGDWMAGEEMLQSCARACADQVVLKVVIESGQVASPALIQQVSEICLRSGADFIKTSTGMTSVGATPAAAKLIAQMIRERGSKCGLVVSGGISAASGAAFYIDLMDDLMGAAWAVPGTFRVEGPGLLGSLLSVIEGDSGSVGGAL